MWFFQKTDPLLFLSGQKFVSVIGGGGKSTFIEHVARRRLHAGETTVVTTTTKIYAKEPFVVFSEIEPSATPRVIRTGRTHEGEKLTGLTFDEVRALGGVAGMVLVEADGAKHHPLKYPSHYEPLIVPFSDHTYVVAGLDALGGRVKEKVFRWELLSGERGIDGDTVISEDVFLSLFDDDAMLKGVEKSKCSVLLNKYDTLSDKGSGLTLAKRIIENTGVAEVVVTSFRFGSFYSVSPR